MDNTNDDSDDVVQAERRLGQESAIVFCDGRRSGSVKTVCCAEE